MRSLCQSTLFLLVFLLDPNPGFHFQTLTATTRTSVGVSAASSPGVCHQDCVHGYCPTGEISYTCTCESGYSGPDCSVRRCPTGKAWSFSENVTDHDVRTECSNMGSCNTTSGVCTCRDGFHGDACQYFTCPNSCSGHGQCMTRQEFEYFNYRGVGQGQAVVGSSGTDWVADLTFEFTEWDANMIEACICDPGWEGYDCSSMLRCPKGDDPLTLGQLDEVQIFECTCPDGVCDTETLRFGFRRTGLSEMVQWSSDVSSLATSDELKAALMGLTSLASGVDVQVGGLADSAVDPICSNTGQSTGVTFTHTPGNLEPLLVVVTSGELTVDM